jgi:hypothetical protein
MRKMLCMLMLWAMFGYGPVARANGYNANWTGIVTSISAYTYNDQIVFSLSSMPSEPAGTCSSAGFMITAADSDAESRARIYATLISAYLTGQPVSVGYDNTGASCSDGFITAFRVGF